MLTYLPDDPFPSRKFEFSYQQLRDDYMRFALMSDDDFLGSLLDILHFTVFVAYVKELQTQWTCSDTGIIHELVHLLMEQKLGEEVTTTPLGKIRDSFNRECCLA